MTKEYGSGWRQLEKGRDDVIITWWKKHHRDHVKTFQIGSFKQIRLTLQETIMSRGGQRLGNLSKDLIPKQK